MEMIELDQTTREYLRGIIKGLSNEIENKYTCMFYVDEKLRTIRRVLDSAKYYKEENERIEKENKERREKVIKEETKTDRLILSGNMVVIDINKEEKE
jgi:hypothetical protein